MLEILQLLLAFKSDPATTAKCLERLRRRQAFARLQKCDLFNSGPPPYNRRFLESRLGYRVQELAYGGLKPETVKRLEALGGEVDGNPVMRRVRSGQKPIAGTRLIREWQGAEHAVTVRDDGYEYRGAPYKSLSSIARAITGTRWNGWVFFGLKNTRVGEAKADAGFAGSARTKLKRSRQ